MFSHTGSSVPADDSEMQHSGTGRFSWLKMRPMTLWESRESSGEASLAALLNGLDITGAKSACPDLDEVAFLLCRGGGLMLANLKDGLRSGVRLPVLTQQ